MVCYGACDFAVNAFIFKKICFIYGLYNAVLRNGDFIAVFRSPFNAFIIGVVGIKPYFKIKLCFAVIRFTLKKLQIILIIIGSGFAVFIKLNLLNEGIFLKPFICRLKLGIHLLYLILSGSICRYHILCFFNFGGVGLISVGIIIFFFKSKAIISVYKLLKLIIVGNNIYLALGSKTAVCRNGSDNAIAAVIKCEIAILVYTCNLIVA